MWDNWTVLLAAAICLVVGAGLGILWRGRPVPPPADSAAVHRSDEPLERTLGLIAQPYILLDTTADVIAANPSAIASGVVRADPHGTLRVADESIRLLALEASRTDSVRTAAVGSDLSVRVGPLEPGRSLMLVSDAGDATRAEESARDFVANVSHELKTPVGAIRLLAETLEDAADDPEAVRRFAGRLGHESVRLTDLVQDIVDLSRVQSRNSMQTAERLDVDELVTEAVDRSANLADRSGIRLVESGTDGLRVFGDRALLVTAIGNLVANAIAYSEAGTRVAVTFRHRDGDVEIAVTDQGIGIPREELDRIFERFYRVDPARSRATGGSGLGLSIVDQTARDHGGSVTVWSSEGKGSTFTLHLPLLPPESKGSVE